MYSIEQCSTPYILQVSSKFRNSCAILSLSRNINKKTWQSCEAIYEHNEIFYFFFSRFFIFLNEVDKSENSRWSGWNAIFAELRSFLRKLSALILFQIDWITEEYLPSNYFNALFKKRIKGSRSWALRRLAHEIL